MTVRNGSDASGGLRKRSYRFSTNARRQHPALKSFLAPQRDRAPRLQHPKPKGARGAR